MDLIESYKSEESFTEVSIERELKVFYLYQCKSCTVGLLYGET